MSTRTALALGLVAVAALTVAQLLIQDGARSWQTISVEDGPVFFGQAHEHGVDTLFEGHAGYGQFVPRGLALAATLVPLASVAAYLAVAGALMTSLCGVAVFFMSRRLMPSVALRLVLASASALLPVMAFENLANIAYTIWPLAFACFWALLAEPRDDRDGVVGGTVAMIGAASNGLTIAFLPLAIYGAVTRRGRPQRIVLAGYALGLLYQAVVILASQGPEDADTAHGLARLFMARVLAGSALGERWAGQAFERFGYWPLEVAAAVVVVLVVGLLVLTRDEPRRLGAIAVGYSIVMFVVPLSIRGTETVDGTGMRLVKGAWSSAGARYVGLSILLLMSGVFVMVSAPRLSVSVRRVLVVLLVAHYVSIVVFAVPSTNWRSGGPTWAAAIDRSAARCQARRFERVLVPITPRGWSINLPCGEVLDAVR